MRRDIKTCVLCGEIPAILNVFEPTLCNGRDGNREIAGSRDRGISDVSNLSDLSDLGYSLPADRFYRGCCGACCQSMRRSSTKAERPSAGKGLAASRGEFGSVPCGFFFASYTHMCGCLRIKILHRCYEKDYTTLYATAVYWYQVLVLDTAVGSPRRPPLDYYCIRALACSTRRELDFCAVRTYWCLTSVRYVRTDDRNQVRYEIP